MNNTLIFLRHAETLKDVRISVSQWILTDKGRTSAQALADTGTFDDVKLARHSLGFGRKKVYLVMILACHTIIGNVSVIQSF